MEDRELDGVIEALLFVANEPLSIKRLMDVLGASLVPAAPTQAGEAEESPSQKEIEGRVGLALERIRTRLDAQSSGIQLVRIAGGFRFMTRPVHGEFIRAMNESKAAAKISRSALEALSITAYREPVTRADIESIRGVDSSNVIRTLLERRLIRIAGRREGMGRPILYATTREFLQAFGLNDLSELPALKEFEEIAGSQIEAGAPEETARDTGSENPADSEAAVAVASPRD